MSSRPISRSGSPASPAESSSPTSSPRPANSNSDDDQPDNDLYPQPTNISTNPISPDDDYQLQPSQLLSRISVENVNQGMLHLLKTFHLVNSQPSQDDDFDDHHEHFQPEQHLASPTTPPPGDRQNFPVANSTPSPSRSLRAHSSTKHSPFSGVSNGHELSGGSLRASSIFAIHRSLSQQSPFTEPHPQSDTVSDASEHPESDDGNDSGSEPENGFTLESPKAEANCDSQSETFPKYDGSPNPTETIPFPLSTRSTIQLGSTVSQSDSSLTVNNMARTVTFDSQSAKSRPSPRRHHAHPNRKASLAKKLQQIFQLPTQEDVLGEYSCWLFRSVLLKGYLYLTTGHVCFYAYLKNNGKEADDDGDVIKAGMLTRRHSQKLKQNRQVKSWFILKDSILSWYPSSHEPYFPTGQIDLHFCTKIESSSPDAKRPNQFKLYVSSKVYTFFSDTQQTKAEWVKVLQEAVFACQHHGQNVKIAIPLANVESVEQCDSMQFAQTIRVKTKDTSGTVPIVQAQAPSTVCEPSDAVLDDYFFGFIKESQALFELIRTTLQVVQASDNLRLVTTDLSDQRVESGSVSMPVTPTVFTTPSCQLGPIRDSTRAPVNNTFTLLKQHTRHSSLLPKHTPDPSGLVHISSGVYESTSRTCAEDRRHGSTLTARLKKISSTGNKLVGSPIRPAANVVKVHSPSGGNGGPSGEQSPASPRTPSPLNLQSTPPLGGLLKPPSPSNNESSPTDSQLGESHTYPPSHRSQYSTQVHQESADRSPRPSRPASPNPAANSSSNSWGVLPGWLKGVPSNLNPIKPAKGAINTAKNLLISAGDSSLPETLRRETSKEPQPEEEDVERLAHEQGQLSERDEHKFRAEFNFLNIPGTASETHNEMRLLLKTKCELTRGGTAVYGQIYIATPAETGTAWPKGGRRACVCFKGHRRIPYGMTKMILPLEEVVKIQAHEARLGLLTVQTDVLVTPETVWFEFASAEQMRAVEAELGRLMEAQKQREEDRDGDSDEAQVPIMFQSSSSSFLTFKPQHKLHITCLTIGSRGDVQPYIALCQKLQSDGHTCRIASHGEYRSWVESYGIEYVGIGGDPAELMKICVDNGTFTLGFLKEALSKFRGWLDDLLSSTYEACKGTDLLIESPSTMAGIHIAEALEIPYFRAFTMPWTRTRDYPHAFAVPDHKMGSGYNYMTYTVFDQVFWRAMAGQVNRWRKETLGLKSTSWEKLESHKVPFLYNFSPTIVPTPLDWFEWVHITGYWFIEEDKVVEGTESKRSKYQPEKGLVEFLDRAKVEGKKVVYIGFGSIVVPDPEALTKTIVAAVEAAGVHAVVTKGWSDRLSGTKEDKQNVKGKGKKTDEHETMDREEAELLQPNPKIYNMKSVPHEWLFPRIDAACHHGGAGTTGASLKAGIPTIIRPFFGDQFFWAERVETLGIGSGVRKMTVKALSQALITATTDQVQIKKAKLVGEQIRSESGTTKAVECIYRDLEYAKSLIKRRPKVAENSSKLPSSTSTVVKAPAEQAVDGRPKARPLQAQTYSSYTKQANGSQSKALTVRSGETNQDSVDMSVDETSSEGVLDHPSPVPPLSSSAEDNPMLGISKPLNIPQQATHTSDEDSSWDILSQSRSDEPADLSSSFDNL